MRYTFYKIFTFTQFRSVFLNQHVTLQGTDRRVMPLQLEKYSGRIVPVRQSPGISWEFQTCLNRSLNPVWNGDPAAMITSGRVLHMPAAYPFLQPAHGPCFLQGVPWVSSDTLGQLWHQPLLLRSSGNLGQAVCYAVCRSFPSIWRDLLDCRSAPRLPAW